MGIQIKGRFMFLAAITLLVTMILAGVALISESVLAAPQEGAFHLKKYVDITDQKEATGQKEDTSNPANSLYGGTVIPGVEYEIYRTHDYTEGKLVEITSGPAAITNNGENYKTDTNGEINITGLPLGQYVFQEVSAPEGIQVNTEKYYFVLPFTIDGNNELQFEVYVYPKNVRLTGLLSFQKVGDNGTEGLKNVEFQAYYEDGSPVKTEEGNILTITTRLSGKAEIEDLQVGKYYLLEIKNPDSDYFVDSEVKYWFQIYESNGEVKSRAFYTDASMETKIMDANKEELAEGVIINYKKTPETVPEESGDKPADVPGNKPNAGTAAKTGDGLKVPLYLFGLLGSSLAIALLLKRSKGKRVN